MRRRKTARMWGGRLPASRGRRPTPGGPARARCCSADSHGGGAPCPPCRRGSFSGKQTAAVGLGKEQAACRGRVRDPSVGSPSRLSRVRVGHSGTPETEGGPTLGAPRGSRPAETLTLTMCVCVRERESVHTLDNTVLRRRQHKGWKRIGGSTL